MGGCFSKKTKKEKEQLKRKKIDKLRKQYEQEIEDARFELDKIQREIYVYPDDEEANDE